MIAPTPRVLVCCLWLTATALADPVRRQDFWQTVTLDGDKIGHRHIIRQVDKQAVTTTETLVITLQQPGEEPRSTETTLVYVESPEGQPLSLEKQIRWHSFDSGLGEFTASYIALGFSDGELADTARVNEQLHRIEIVSTVQVKSR